MIKQPKVTICPPAEQSVFFQEKQFDPELGGADPSAYVRGQLSDKQRRRLPSAYGREVKKSRLKKAKQALEGHENKEEILKILRSE